MSDYPQQPFFIHPTSGICYRQLADSSWVPDLPQSQLPSLRSILESDTLTPDQRFARTLPVLPMPAATTTNSHHSSLENDHDTRTPSHPSFENGHNTLNPPLHITSDHSTSLYHPTHETARSEAAATGAGHAQPRRGTPATPEDDSDDQAIMAGLSRELASAHQAGGSRPSAPAKAKAKGRADVPQASSSKRKAPHDAADEPVDAKKRTAPGFKGRIAGAPNYNNTDVGELLSIVRAVLPIGGRAWQEVERLHNEWAESTGRPTRSAKSLEAKFKQLVCIRKPTGSAECPPHVEAAQEIEDLINEKAGTRDLNDDEIVDIADASDDENSNHNTNDKGKGKASEPGPSTVSRGRSQAPRAPRHLGADLLQTISASLDPQARAEREAERTACSLHTAHTLHLSSQLREANTTINNLRNLLHEAERRADRLELRAQVMADLQQPGAGAGPSSFNRLNNILSDSTNLEHTTRVRCVRYADGGAATVVINPGDDENQGLDDEGVMSSWDEGVPQPEGYEREQEGDHE
ncbi:hypothetical protein CONPUDRAFT_156983 [Coniophora puteana RWD-64-598 SS2]|uniref:DUF6818 domain-containing protein n=1 Tax=Coniophora puteana (strain RWD-64-598) TaxID=741705 RepID=A0A5M3MEV4_CONPW|nr:uncharacterized protein CONPUDRAFT_156983 [Coniophora puteana RWD-64-598 SS2]EIW77799.1 hypothetical protein CONPUDRAFT_156983 [Coniophora puteana RWD-64-598 SS2]